MRRLLQLKSWALFTLMAGMLSLAPPPAACAEPATTAAAKRNDGIEGRYDYGAAILAVSREGGTVFAQLTGQPKFEIFPKSADTFYWKVVEAEVTFVRDEKGVVSKAIHKQGGQTIDAPRLA